jgi:hypothetical protein
VQVQNEIRKWCFKRRLNSNNTRSILLSSWRKSSRRMSRDTTRDTRISSDCNIHPNGTCTDTCKLNNMCHEHATWPRKSRAVTKEKFKTLSWQSEHNDCVKGEPDSLTFGEGEV